MARSYFESTLAGQTQPAEQSAGCPDGFVWYAPANRCLTPNVIQWMSGGSGVYGEGLNLGQTIGRISASTAVIVIGIALILLAVYAWVNDKPISITLSGAAKSYAKRDYAK